MTEINKRILTSIALLLMLILSVFNKYILTLVCIFIIYQILFEFNYMLKKIFIFNRKKIFYFIFLFIIIYVTFSIIYVWLILISDNNDKILLYILIITCISTDIGGYIFGKLFKGKKLTKISPNKTYSGMIGSYFLSIIIIILNFKFYMDVDKLFFLIIIASTISQFGDLLISYIKRKAKIKDTSSILPGHGGLLDRIDGIIFSVPICLIIYSSVWLKM